jgi:hypothetical protein
MDPRALLSHWATSSAQQDPIKLSTCTCLSHIGLSLNVRWDKGETILWCTWAEFLAPWDLSMDEGFLLMSFWRPHLLNTELTLNLARDICGWASTVAHICNPSYSGGRHQEDHGLKPAWANSSRDPILKNLSQNIGLVEWLKVKVLSSSPSTTKINK